MADAPPPTPPDDKRPVVGPYGRGMQDVWALCQHQSVLIPADGGKGAAAECYIWVWPHPPAGAELAHLLDMARKAMARSVVLFLLCCHADALAAIKAAIAQDAAPGASMTLQ
jgi:hypothetical protein